MQQLLFTLRMKPTNFSLLILLVLFQLTSCKTLEVEKPVESYLPSRMEPAESVLPLGIEIDVKSLESSLNKELQGLLFEGKQLNNQDLSVKVWKARNFTFTIKNNVIEYTVPLRLWSQFRWTYEKFGLKVGDEYEASGSIALKFSTSVDIDRNWKLVSRTTANGYEWIETPRINVLGVTVPVTPIANYALQESRKLLTSEIDKALAGMVDLKQYAGLAWSELQKPVLLDQSNQLWLKITPQEVLLSPFESRGQKLNLTLWLKAAIESYMGAQPAATTPVTLPAFKTATSRTGDFNLNIAADATFAKISELARGQLLNKTFQEGKNSITITDLQLYGRNGKAVFQADVIGSVKGRIYFTGDMVYNAEKMTVEVINPDFDLNTRNALLKSANWLLHGIIIKKITPYLSYPVKPELDNAINEANKMLANYKVFDGINLQGKLNTLNVTRLDLVPGAVRLHANLTGKVGLKIDNLKISTP